MSKETIAITTIIFAVALFTIASVLSVMERDWYRRLSSLSDWVDECDNTIDNWHIAIKELNICKKSRLLKDTDVAAVEKKIYEKFLLK